MKCLALALIGLLGCIADVAQGGPGFHVLEGTASPDGRYAFAWGLPEKYAVDWDKVRKGEQDPLASIEDSDDPVENYLVDLKAEKILARVPEAKAWQLPKGRQSNHRDLDVLWSKQGDVALALYSGKWGYGSFTAFRISEGKVSSPLNIGSPLEKAWRAYLRKAHGERYQKKKKSLVVSFHSMQVADENSFSVEAHAEVPKSSEGEDVFPERRIQFSIAGPQVDVQSIEETSGKVVGKPD